MMQIVNVYQLQAVFEGSNNLRIQNIIIKDFLPETSLLPILFWNQSTFLGDVDKTKIMETELVIILILL